jgi:hypothetical protein
MREGQRVSRLETGGGQAVERAGAVVGPVGEGRAGYPGGGGLGLARTVAPKATGAQPTQRGVEGKLATLVGSSGFAAGDFGQDAMVPAGKAGHIFAFVDEVVSP